MQTFIVSYETSMYTHYTQAKAYNYLKKYNTCIFQVTHFVLWSFLQQASPVFLLPLVWEAYFWLEMKNYSVRQTTCKFYTVIKFQQIYNFVIISRLTT